MEVNPELEKSVPMENADIANVAEDTIAEAPEYSKETVENVAKLGDITVTTEMRDKINAFYGRKAEAEGIAPSADFTYILDKILAMTEEEATEILLRAIEYHSNDANFPGPTMEKIKLLVKG